MARIIPAATVAKGAVEVEVAVQEAAALLGRLHEDAPPELFAETAATAALQVQRGMDLPPEYGRGEARSIAVDGGDDLVGDLVLDLVPVLAARQVVLLAERQHHALVEQRLHMRRIDLQRATIEPLRIGERDVAQRRPAVARRP